jgi:hypothetical protein
VFCRNHSAIAGFTSYGTANYQRRMASKKPAGLTSLCYKYSDPSDAELAQSTMLQFSCQMLPFLKGPAAGA